MRKLPFMAIAALLLPVGAAAQKRDSASGHKAAPAAAPAAGRSVDMRVRISQVGARNVALGETRMALLKGASPCCDRMNSRNLRVAFTGDVIVHWRHLYVVAVETPGMMSHMRVLLDPMTGQVVDLRQGKWLWNLAPEWWRHGLNQPEPTRH